MSYYDQIIVEVEGGSMVPKGAQLVGKQAIIPIVRSDDDHRPYEEVHRDWLMGHWDATESPQNPARSSFIGSDWLEVPSEEESPEHKRARVADAYYRQVFGAPPSTLSSFQSVMKDTWNSGILAQQLFNEITASQLDLKHQINRQFVGDPTWKPRKISFLKRKARRLRSKWEFSRWHNALHEIRYHDHDMWD